jgi:DNA polymerase-3 subunit delta'
VSWQRVKGHDSQVKQFELARERGRLAHAYLFTGPPGVGKRLFAIELAKALLCERTDKLEACDRCEACHLVDAGTHPDFFTLARAEEAHEISIEDMRELCRNFTLKSARGRHKIALVDDADELNEESANCFLKTLEEPPPGSVFLLIGTSVDRQLPTIVSRCQLVRFAPLPESLVLEVLREHEVAEPSLLPKIVKLTGGSPGQALALADPALWQFRRKLLDRLFRPRPDTPELAKEWMQFNEDAGKESASQRRRASLVLRLLMEFLDDALAVMLRAPPRALDTDDQRLLNQLNQRVTAEQILLMLDRCLEADRHIDRYVQLVLAIEGLLDALGQVLTPLPVTPARLPV